jgi:hypothetical protein
MCEIVKFGPFLVDMVGKNVCDFFFTCHSPENIFFWNTVRKIPPRQLFWEKMGPHLKI